MIRMLVRNQVRGFDVWKRVLDEDRDRWGEAGLALAQLWRSIEDPDEVFFLLAFEDSERARASRVRGGGERASVLDRAVHDVEEAD